MVSEKIGTRKKSRKRYPKKVSEPVSEKFGTGIVSELVSKIFYRNFLLIQCKFIVFIIEIFIFVAQNLYTMVVPLEVIRT